MGTKRDPGRYDCHSKALLDEPIFTLLGRDPYAPMLVRRWAEWASINGINPDKVREALKVADDMEKFRINTAPDQYKESRFTRARKRPQER